ncbi:hypothetical protein SCOCK_80009 [Actinacidiphila cocklensis]|uniref:Uncharacterized protein n=1 Tax=Actinacidiphila cocklensis TaxID=887465 RepID=A0A9W4EBP7_9ACTN|nr:hypothetical protein SCOCK_80009 [Actinacidiphila cocklensis]
MDQTRCKTCQQRWRGTLQHRSRARSSGPRHARTAGPRRPPSPDGRRGTPESCSGTTRSSGVLAASTSAKTSGFLLERYMDSGNPRVYCDADPGPHHHRPAALPLPFLNLPGHPPAGPRTGAPAGAERGAGRTTSSPRKAPPCPYAPEPARCWPVSWPRRRRASRSP